MLPIPNTRGSRRERAGLAVVGAVLALATGCSAGRNASSEGSEKTIVVTYSILGSLVRDAVGDLANVVVLIPNGSDPHDWAPSAKDIERLNNADLIVRNGLDLESGMQDALDRAEENGVPMFSASDHITVRIVGEGEGLPTGDPDQAAGAPDPHLWMDPIALRDVMSALGPVLVSNGIDATAGVATVTTNLDELDIEVRNILDAVPEPNRQLVTGHESLGYFADRYDFQLIGAITPSLTTQAGVSAAELAALTDAIEQHHVKAIFTEVGTPAQVAEAIGDETGVDVIELATHNLPDDGMYSSFLIEDAKKVAAALA